MTIKAATFEKRYCRLKSRSLTLIFVMSQMLYSFVFARWRHCSRT